VVARTRPRGALDGRRSQVLAVVPRDLSFDDPEPAAP
jgi:hypothetical protein